MCFFHYFQFQSRKEGNSKKVALILAKKKKIIASIKQKEEILFVIQKLTPTDLGERVYEAFEKLHPSPNLLNKL